MRLWVGLSSALSTFSTSICIILCFIVFLGKCLDVKNGNCHALVGNVWNADSKGQKKEHEKDQQPIT